MTAMAQPNPRAIDTISIEATVLGTYYDVIRAGPGIYLVQSGTGAYFPMLALIEAGIAEFAGETYHDRGHVVAARIQPLDSGDSVSENPPQERRSITIGPEFFITALKDYNDWSLKWWREAVQNSVDAGARNIDLGATKNPDGTMTVWADDDGSGMDQATIIDKFLVLGATTKTITGGAAGGFGKAKELLLLPWLSWKIHSLDTLVKGAGIDYSVETAPSRRGTRLEVVMPADRTTDGAMAIGFVEKCFLPDVNFTINGERHRANLGGGKVVQSIVDKADVSLIPLKKGETQSYIYVRTRGLYMFSYYVGEVPGYLVAELLAPSVEVLTANRDGFRDRTLERAISQFAERLAKDTLSALKAGRGLIRKKYEGTGKFKARERAAGLLEQIGPYRSGSLEAADAKTLVVALGEYAKEEEAQLVTASGQLSAVPSTAVIEAMLDQRFLGPEHLQTALKQLVWAPDFYLINDIEDYKVPKKFYPETMTPTVFKLAKVWAELCRYVLMQLGSASRFGIGFHFSESTAASALEEKNYEGRMESWLLLNPFKDLFGRKEIWRTADDDLKWLYAAAIHESTHIADQIQYHDESFAAALTRNMARCAAGYRKIKQIAAGIRMRGAPEL